MITRRWCDCISAFAIASDKLLITGQLTLSELKIQNGKLIIMVLALPTILIISEGNTLIFNFPLSILNLAQMRH